ncbi:MAG: hypothetical protein C7B45_10255 [Sulfobacillus acidophilus]|uniref:MobA-like NTP transferase domain-containing protein n=1 Tax=Sulfobacillus acidophilus TaxID=53633 RepID=A0A2T2WH67_9FIRM|nr:MAG: hypothetical protein C7B45_10255 [Sulfobacillus acidophilus]
MHAILLAGQPNRGLLKATHPNLYEAEIPVGGRAMADWVLDALQASSAVSSIGLVGPDSLQRDNLTIAPMAQDLFGNILQGLKTAPPQTERVLFVTSDIPWISGPIIDTFLQRAPRDVDVVYPVIPKVVVESRFPGTKRTYIRLREGVFTGGNIFLAKVSAVPGLKERAEVLLAHRKSPWKLARDIGPGLLLRLVAGRLSLDDVQRRVGRILGISGCALVFPYAEVGVDVDKPEDLALAERELGTQASEASGQGWDIS